MKLASNVIVAHPETRVPILLAAGTDLPDWAEGLVGEHVLEARAGHAEGSKSNGYESLKVAELQAEIAMRNADRDESEQIRPEGTTKAVLVAALLADDADDE